MKISNLRIKNFRGIQELDGPVSLGDLSIFVGDNGTGKTTILEAINYCLSPSFVASRLGINDFHNGSEGHLEITVEFDEPFIALVPDGFAQQEVQCDRVAIKAKKREKAAPGKAFTDLVTATHWVVPVAERGERGWSQPRKNGRPFEFTERSLLFSNVEAALPRVFYFSKSRARQLTKGFNSSMTSIIADLNWRFERAQRTKGDDHFKHRRKTLHESVFADTGPETLEKTIEAANMILDKLGIAPIALSLLKTLSPYDGSEMVFSFDGFELPVDLSGSGVEMAISLALLEAMASLSRDKLVVLIDEPELHLHPKLQAKLFDHLTDISATMQVAVSTHSPILFKNTFHNDCAKLQVTFREDSKVRVLDAHSFGFGHLPWSPSWGEICYLAYDLPTVEFHDDLYSAIEDSVKPSPDAQLSQEQVERWFESRGHIREVSWIHPSKGVQRETLMTFVRNRIHHPDNRNRREYTPEELRESIARMCCVMRPPPHQGEV